MKDIYFYSDEMCVVFIWLVIGRGNDNIIEFCVRKEIVSFVKGCI